MKQLIFYIILILAISITKSSAQCAKEPLTIFLLSGFNKDHIEFIVDDKKIFNDVITTDPSDGVAASLYFKRGVCKQHISLKVGGVLLHTMWLDNREEIVIKALGYSKAGIFISTEYLYNKLPLFD